jgi:uncharacterized protein YdhG (YjbR/CyaY superfamily)
MPRGVPRSPEVERYILDSPASARAKLRSVRAAIRSVAPDAIEAISYRMPGYSYPGHRNGGVFVWFKLETRHIGLYLRTPIIEAHALELARYSTTKHVVQLPLNQPIPVALVRKLVRASRRVMIEGRRQSP